MRVVVTFNVRREKMRGRRESGLNRFGKVGCRVCEKCQVFSLGCLFLTDE